jgi:hypothetical protein
MSYAFCQFSCMFAYISIITYIFILCTFIVLSGQNYRESTQSQPKIQSYCLKLIFQIVDFSSGNDLKFTYMHLQFQFFFGGYTPGPHNKRDGRGGKGWEGRGLDEPPPKTNPVYGPEGWGKIPNRTG